MGGAKARWANVKCDANVNDQILFFYLLCCPPSHPPASASPINTVLDERFLCVCSDEIASEV